MAYSKQYIRENPTLPTAGRRRSWETKRSAKQNEAACKQLQPQPQPHPASLGEDRSKHFKTDGQAGGPPPRFRVAIFCDPPPDISKDTITEARVATYDSSTKHHHLHPPGRSLSIPVSCHKRRDEKLNKVQYTQDWKPRHADFCGRNLQPFLTDKEEQESAPPPKHKTPTETCYNTAVPGAPTRASYRCMYFRGESSTKHQQQQAAAVV